MKKLLFAVITLFALTSFTSCEKDELSDAELISKIQGYTTYDGKDWENDKMYFRVLSNKYILDYSAIAVADFDAKYAEYQSDPAGAAVYFAGTWDVRSGILYLNDLDGNTYSGVVENDGKKIVLKKANGTDFATLTK
jgi:hypothetical protein